MDLIEGSARRSRPPTGQPVPVLVVANKSGGDPGSRRGRARRAEPARRVRPARAEPEPRWPSTATARSTTRESDVRRGRLPALEQAAGGQIEGRVATSPNAYDDIVAELDAGDYSEIILETPPSHVSHWLHVDSRTASPTSATRYDGRRHEDRSRVEEIRRRAA